MRIELVMLDNNGTMLDDLHVAYASACATFDRFGAPHPTLDEYRNGMTSHWREFYWSHGIPRSVTGEEMNAVRRVYYAEHSAQARYRPDLERFLRFCQERGLKLAVVSAEISDILRAALDREDLTGYFDHIEVEAWPKPPGLVRTIVKLRVMPERAVYVDDTYEGVSSAKMLGIRTIGFTHPTGFSSEERIKAADPDRTARNFAHVAAAMRTL